MPLNNKVQSARQYEFCITHNNTGGRAPVYVTGYTPAAARQAVVDSYGNHYVVSDSHVQVRKAHYFYGEIDCT